MINKERETIRDILKSYFKEQGYSNPKGIYDELKSSLKEYFPIDFLDHQKTSIFRKNIEKELDTTGTRKRNICNIIRILFFAYNIPYSIFGLEKEDIFPTNNPIKNINRRFLSIQDAELANSKFDQNYKNFINACFEGLTSRLRIYDYMGKGQQEYPGQTLKHYLETNKDVYSEITRLLNDKKKNIIYTRVMALPIYAHFKKEGLENLPEVVGRQILHECSYQLFEHICYCIENFGSKTEKTNLGDKVIEVAKVQFFVCYMPSRTYQYAIIDDVLLYNEYYEIDKNGSSMPSFIIANNVQKDIQMKDFYNIYDHEFSKHTIDGDYVLDKENVCDYFESLLKFYNKEWKKQKGEESIFNKSRNKLKAVINIKIDTINEVFNTDFKKL